ncbi:unnamed protein product [Clonostachys rosea]|uniref:Rieske domain-containing protein n=1 Tax=Bionectria ochroleuca TaxID=29856 RepID=A0ABY6UW33_BIOOC|nr:unnamed protein product [Clonostachys rosea]
MEAPSRKRVAVVGLGMVAIAFIEKLLNYDAQSGRDEWEITVFGEEPYIAYNRVGLTQYFATRSIADLYLNPLDWYSSFAEGKLKYITSDPVTSIDANSKTLKTSNGIEFVYDECVLATGSGAALPPFLSRDRFNESRGSFVYRTIKDLDDIIEYATDAPRTLGRSIRKAAVIGGGLLGLEAAKALLDLGEVGQVILIEGDGWLLSRQLDQEGGNLVLQKVKSLGVEVYLGARVQSLLWDSEERINGLILQGKGGEPDQQLEIDMLVFTVGIRPRDELSKTTGLAVTQRPGGFIVNTQLRTNLPNIYAIGECANYLGQVYGLIAPGVEMADVLAFNFTEGPHHKFRQLQVPDLSTKLKLMGVDVASFGDYFADRGMISKPIPGTTPRTARANGASQVSPPLSPDEVKAKFNAVTYRDPFSNTYKKYIFTTDGKYLLGGMMVGDVKDYVKLVAICRKGSPMEKPPSQFILGAKADGEEEGDDLPDDAQICSCHNVTKGAITQCVKNGVRSFGEVKTSTKCGTGCGGCVPLATSIFNRALVAAGVEISNHICKDFAYSRQDLYQIIKFRKLKDFTAVMKGVGKKPDSLGCEVCRPAVGSILSSVFNEWIMKPSLRQTQDTNDRYLANMQRDGTYSVVPRLPAGEITPDSLVVIGQIAGEFGLYAKITGGQRIDMFGARKQDLPQIWEKLIKAGFESGHAYGKALRTVKSCVGSTWCRYGVGDSVGLAVELEQRYKGLRAPHKLKGGVSGCIRECAEAQGKDFGLIATPKGWNVYVGGNGGAKPRHAELIAENVTRREAVRIIDRFIIFYIRSADILERTARWVESYPGGLQGVKDVVVSDKLGICADLEQEMDSLVDSDYSIMTFEAKEDLENDQVLLKLPPTEALDAVLSTSKWMLLKAKEESDVLARDSNHSIEFAEPRTRMDATRADESRPAVACGGGSSLEW